MFETPNNKKMLVCFSDTEDEEESDIDLSSSSTTTPLSETKRLNSSSMNTPLQSLINNFNQMSLGGSSSNSTTPKKIIPDMSFSPQINYFGNPMQEKENLFTSPVHSQSPMLISPSQNLNEMKRDFPNKRSSKDLQTSTIKQSASVEKQQTKKKKHSHSQDNNIINLTPMTKSRLLDKLKTQELEFQKMQELSILEDKNMFAIDSNYDEKVRQREKLVSEINESIVNKIRETEMENHEVFLKKSKQKISAALEGTSKIRYQDHLGLFSTLLEHRANCQIVTTISQPEVDSLKKQIYSTLVQLSPYKEDLTTTALQIVSLLLQFSSRNEERWVDMTIDILCDQIILISSSWCSINQSYGFGFAYFCVIISLFYGKKFLPCLMHKFNRICSFTIPLYFTYESARRMLNLDHPELEKTDPEYFRHLAFELMGFTHELEPEGSRIKRRNGIVLTFGAFFGNSPSEKYYEIISFLQSLIVQNDDTLKNFPFVLEKFYSFKQQDFEENRKLFEQYFGIEKGFGWISTILNQPPRDCSCGIIDFFLRGCGYALWQEIPDQFEKLMKHLLNSYLPIVPDSTPIQIVQRVKKFAQLTLNHSLQPQKASFLPLIAELYQQQQQQQYSSEYVMAAAQPNFVQQYVAPIQQQQQQPQHYYMTYNNNPTKNSQQNLYKQQNVYQPNIVNGMFGNGFIYSQKENL